MSLLKHKKYLSGYEKRKKKQKLDEFIQSQKGAIDKFFLIAKNQVDNEERVEDLVNEQEQNVGRDGNEEMEHSGGYENEEHETVATKIVNDNNPSIEEVNEKEQPSRLNIYDPNSWGNIDQNLKELLVKRGPVRDMDTDFKYPLDSYSRHFSPVHYFRRLPNGEKYERKWLVYSKLGDKVFCFCCEIFKQKQEGNNSYLATNGFKDWKNLACRLKSHEGSSEHVICMSRCIEMETRMKKNETIDKKLQEQINKEKTIYWRQVLLRIISLVRTLSQQNVAFRGENEMLYEDGNGIFLKFIEMIATFDPIMEEHVRRIQTKEIHYHYLSHMIQNELVRLLGNEVKTAILERIKKVKYFSVILDCTPDISHREQMTLVIRCVDATTSPIKVQELFLGFLRVDVTTGLGLFSALETVLENLELHVNDIRGQGYDNGSNMKGKHKGVQKRLLDKNPTAFYMPCGCHSLNLALCDMVNCCSKGKNFFEVIQRIYCLFSASSKRWKILKNNVEGLTPKALSQTRWESHLESVKPLLRQTEEIRDALLDLAHSDEEGIATSEAEGLKANEFENFEFLLSLVIWYDLLFYVNSVSKTLQKSNMHMDVALQQLRGLIILFENYRETGFEKAKIEAGDIAAKMGVQPVFREERVIKRKRQFDEIHSEDVTQTAEENFRK